MPNHQSSWRLGGPSFNVFDIGTSRPPSPPQAPSKDTVEFPYNSRRRIDSSDASAGTFRDNLDASTGKSTVATECSSSSADCLSLSEGSHVGTGAANEEGAYAGGCVVGIVGKSHEEDGNGAPKLVCIIEGHEEMEETIPSVQAETGSNAKPGADDSRARAVVERSVSFSRIEIREYPRTLGDHPDVFMGPPVSMYWCYAEMDVESVDEYERNRGPRRKLGQMRMHPNVRDRMLTEAGISKEEVKDAERLTRKVQKQRNWTVSSDAALPIVGVVEEGVQSLRRKIKRRSWRSGDGDYYGKAVMKDLG